MPGLNCFAAVSLIVTLCMLGTELTIVLQVLPVVMLSPHAWIRVQNSPAGFAVAMLCLHDGTGCTAVIQVLPIAIYALSTCMSQGSKQSCRFFASWHALSTCMAQGLPQSCRYCQLTCSLYIHDTVFITVLQVLPVAMLPLRA